MKHAGPLEIEIKLAIADLDGMGLRLAQGGFGVVHGQGPEISELWDRNGELREQGSALRLRRYAGGALLTWKGARLEDPRLKIRPELETALEDPEAMAGILAAIGFQPFRTMVKSRSLWRRGELEACLDETPFGRYLELEGSPEAIQEALEQLGLAGSPIERRSYATLFELFEAGELS
jgi:adenylate cyclase class 2